MRLIVEENTLEEFTAMDMEVDGEVTDGILRSLERSLLESAADILSSDVLFFFPLLRRPFFPGMAAPLMIEPGPFYNLLKIIANTEQKSLGLLLTKNEDIDIHKCTFDDLHTVGVKAKILRIIPLEQG
jgi:ATP-dependent Lon protease